MNAPVDFRAIESMFRRKYEQIEVRFDPELAAAWTYMKPTGVPCFNLGLLEELRAHDSTIEANGGRVLHKGELRQIRYYIGASKIENVFNLGGDLALFLQLIASRDRDRLADYAKLCIDSVYPRICNYRLWAADLRRLCLRM
jgi:DSF synthase